MLPVKSRHLLGWMIEFPRPSSLRPPSDGGALDFVLRNILIRLWSGYGN